MPLVRVHVYVSGHVQGVFYRDYTQRQAKAHGVTGWVCNLSDGRVEAVFEGEEQAVQRMVAWCRQGSPNSYVAHVEAHPEPHTGEYTGFAVRY